MATPRLLDLRGSQSTRNAPLVPVIRHHYTRYCLRPGHRKTKGNSYSISMTGVGSTQSTATCDPTKSPGAVPVGTIVVKEYRKWKRSGRMVCGLGRGKIPTGEGGEEWAD